MARTSGRGEELLDEGLRVRLVQPPGSGVPAITVSVAAASCGPL